MLGSGPPGGSWHRMDANLRTLSLSAWMSLPGLDFNTWIAARELDASNEHNSNNNTINTTSDINKQFKVNPNCNNKSNQKSNENIWWRCFSNLQHRNANNKLMTMVDKMDAKCEPSAIEVKLNDENRVSAQILQTPVPRRVLSVRRQVSREVQTRALVSDVAQYYENYVNKMNLERYFQNNTIVTCVKPITSSTNKHVRWLVRGIHVNTGTLFAYFCQNVVLANGASDLANRLGVGGEGSNEWVKHDLPALVSVLEQVPDTERTSKSRNIAHIDFGKPENEQFFV